MTSQGTKIPIYSGNSGGSPAVVIGTVGSGSPPINSTSGGSTFTSGTLYHCVASTGSAGAYAVTHFATATPAGAISEKTKSPEQVAFETRKARLIAFVNGMKKSAPNWTGASLSVSDLSAQSAEKFLQCLPGNTPLPRVAPDGEGDIMFVWDGPTSPSCVVTVEKNTLHLVSRIGSPEAKQIDNQKFLGVRIPPAILRHIPSK